MSALCALVIATGADLDELRSAPPADIVICADGGLEAAAAAGCRVDLVVGDFDSASDSALTAAAKAGATLERHEVDKDESDLELALAAALVRGATEIRVHLAAAGRLDHQLANLFVLASSRWEDVTVSAIVGTDRAWVVRGSRVLPLERGAPLALLAIGGPALGVRTHGLRFELHDESLDATVARGIANVVEVAEPEVHLRAGVILAINSRT